MFNNKRGGWTMHVPDEDPDVPRADSPRWSHNRNDRASQRADETMARAGHMLVRTENGDVVRVAGWAGVKEGWRVLGRAPSETVPHAWFEVPAKKFGERVLTAATKLRAPLSQRERFERKGWAFIGLDAETCGADQLEDLDAECEVRNRYGHIIGSSVREGLVRDLENSASDINRKARPTGRTLLVDGEFVTELDGNDDIAAAPTHGQRIADAGIAKHITHKHHAHKDDKK